MYIEQLDSKAVLVQINRHILPNRTQNELHFRNALTSPRRTVQLSFLSLHKARTASWQHRNEPLSLDHREAMIVNLPVVVVVVVVIVIDDGFIGYCHLDGAG